MIAVEVAGSPLAPPVPVLARPPACWMVCRVLDVGDETSKEQTSRRIQFREESSVLWKARAGHVRKARAKRERRVTSRRQLSGR